MRALSLPSGPSARVALLEGLGSRSQYTGPGHKVLEFLPKGQLQDRIEAAAGRGISFLLRAQVISGPEAGGVPGSVLTRERDSSEIRTDYVQHALCRR